MVRMVTVLVVGAALVMMTGEYIYMNFPERLDISRVGAQVIIGVGFFFGGGSHHYRHWEEPDKRIGNGSGLVGLRLYRSDGGYRPCGGRGYRPCAGAVHPQTPYKVGRIYTVPCKDLRSVSGV